MDTPMMILLEVVSLTWAQIILLILALYLISNRNGKMIKMELLEIDEKS